MFSCPPALQGFLHFPRACLLLIDNCTSRYSRNSDSGFEHGRTCSPSEIVWSGVPYGDVVWLFCSGFELLHFILHSFSSYNVRKGNWKFLFYFFYTINYYIYANTYINITTALWHLTLVELFLWLLYSLQSALINSLFTVLIASLFLVQVSCEGCLGWDTGLALDAWFHSLQY